MKNVGQREVSSERMGQNREAITLMDNCLGPGAFARSLIYNNLEILISLCPHFTVKEIEVQREQDTQKKEECESGINTSLYICPWIWASQCLLHAENHLETFLGHKMAGLHLQGF